MRYHLVKLKAKKFGHGHRHRHKYDHEIRQYNKIGHGRATN